MMGLKRRNYLPFLNQGASLGTIFPGPSANQGRDSSLRIAECSRLSHGHLETQIRIRLLRLGLGC